MMPQGYTGLSKRENDSQLPAAQEPKKGIATAIRQPDRYAAGSLHLVEVDRRRPERADLSKYWTVSYPDLTAYFVFKRLFDILGASIAILFLSPVIAVIVIFSLASGRSPFYRHRRVGRGGIFFDCLKFRTMVKDADRVLQNLLNSDRHIKEEWLRDHKLRDDPRVTRFGRFLRGTSLDELPQLWNVLRGDMSLVGPRPVVPDELARYGRSTATFLSARPGITGLWQVSGRNDTDYRRRVALDVCYVRSRSAALDAYILMKTLPAVFAKSGAY